MTGHLASLGERRSPLAERERLRLIEHFVSLRKHVHVLSVQVLSLGGKPAKMPKADIEEVAQGERILHNDLERHPVPGSTRTRAEIRTSSTRARIESFLRAQPGEHSTRDIALAIGATSGAVSVALSKSRELFQSRKVKQDQPGGRRVLYQLANADDDGT